jgi:MoaA/NifB/PqqE/SkfB family radical SAM enzyme
MIEPKPTTRAVLEPSLRCNINCKFCYHKYKMEQKYFREQTLGDMFCKVHEVLQHGDNYVDITGGEPTMYPGIVKLVEHIKNVGLGCCIITNGLASKKRTAELQTAGVDDWLISVHGMRKTHDMLTGCNGARNKQMRFMDQISKTGKFRFNCVISKFNQHEISQMAEWMALWKPTIVNFINMNPHGEWMGKKEDTAKVIADLRVVEPQLNYAVEMLEKDHVGVNVRYYPMCRIKPEYRRVVCNQLHVCLDPYEWSYPALPKTFENYAGWGVKSSKNVEWKGKPCRDCDLQNICGGLHKAFFRAGGHDMINAVKDETVDKNDAFHYRRFNDMTLKEVRYGNDA